MIKFDDDKVLLLHALLIKETGGLDGVRDHGILNSAIESAYQTFDGKELFPTKLEKAARLGFGLVSNHAFVDGNKRIGVFVMLSFLEMSGYHFDFTNDELIHIGQSLADGTMKYEDLLMILKSKDWE